MLKKFNSFLFSNTSLRQTITKNAFWLLLGEILSRVMKFVLILLAARTLGSSGLGAFSYAISIAGLFLVISDLGLNNLVTREISRNSEQKLKYLSTAFFIRLALILVSIALMIILSPFFIKISGVQEILVVIVISLALDSLRDYLIGIHRAFEKMEIEAFIKIITGISTVILGTGILLLKPSVLNLAYAYLFGSAIGIFVVTVTLREYIANLIRNFSSNLISPIIRVAWPLFISGIIGIVMTNTDIVMLGFWRSTEEIGLYSVAQRLIQFLLIIPNLFALTILPIFSRLIVNNVSLLNKLFEKAVSVMFLISLPITVGGGVLGADLINLLFGQEYADAGIAFQIFISMLVITFPLLIFNSYIFAHNMQRKFISYTIWAAILNVILNYFLIQEYGIYGAAFATVFSSLMLTILVWIKINLTTRFKILPRIRKIALSSLGMGATTLLVNNLEVNLFINIAISASIFFSALILLKEPLLREVRYILSPEELN